jgi:hypothetical protein
MAKNKNITTHNTHNILNNNFYIFVLIILLIIMLFILSSCINKSSFTFDINNIIIDKQEGFKTKQVLKTYNKKEMKHILSKIINLNYSYDGPTPPPDEYKGVWDINSDELIITGPIDNFTKLHFNIKKYEPTVDASEQIAESTLLILEDTSQSITSNNLNNKLIYPLTDDLKNELYKGIEDYRNKNKIQGYLKLYLSGEGTSDSNTITYNTEKYPIRIIESQNMSLKRNKINNKNEYILNINKKAVDGTYIYKNDILQIYDTTVPKEDLKLNKDLFFFKVDNVSFNTNNNFIITINDINTITKLDNDYDEMKIITEINYNNKLIVKVKGNQYKKCILTDKAQLLKSKKRNKSIQYELVFNLLDNRRTDGDGTPLNDKKLNAKIKDFYKIDDNIEIISKHINPVQANNIFVVKGTHYDTTTHTTTLLLNTSSKDVKEINKDDAAVKEEFLVTKFDLNEILKEFYESQTQYNIDYLVTKNKIQNYGTMIDNIKEKIGLNL